MPSDSPHAVFLSYASQDAEAAARLCAALRAAGVEVWFDQNELGGGDAWDNKIRKQIAECALFVPVISAATQARLEGYFRIEWKLAAQRTHAMAEAKPFLLPVVIDATRDAEAHVPAEFKAVQWTRLPDGEASEKFCARVKTLLGPEMEPGRPRPAERGEAAASPTSPHSRRRLPAAAWIAAALALVVAVSLWLRRPASESPPPADLRRDASATTPPAAAQKSIAVLAFKNLSGDPAREFFSDGLSEAVTDVLGRVPGLKVVGSASAFSFKGKSASIPEIARQLGVTHLVDGTVIQDGQTVRITAKLIQADGFQVWVSDKLERESKNIFALHDEVAGLIAKNLSLKLGASSAASKAAVNPQAFELYVQGRQAWAMRNADGYNRAEELLTQALQLDQNFARAHAGLADVRMLRAFTEHRIGQLRQRQAPEFAQIRRDIDRALALDPNSSDAYAGLGFLEMLQWNPPPAEHALRLALKLNPNNANAHHWLSDLMCSIGQIDESLAAGKLATELDPLAPVNAGSYASILFMIGRYEESFAVIDRALAVQPDASVPLLVKIATLARLGRVADAVQTSRKLVDDDWRLLAFALGNMKFETEQLLPKVSDHEARWIALESLGRHDEAMRTIDPAGMVFPDASFILFLDTFDPVRSDPRMTKIVADYGLTEAHARAQAWRAAHPPEKPAAK
ncbi:MAG: hypothetical protein RLZZ15_2929 [Verrucomicrobiota bacterium]